MKTINISFLLFSLLLVSCSGPRFVVAPPFTSVDHIIKLSQGQTIDQVNSELGIQAYDILYLNDGNMLCFYNYRLLDRKINLDSPSAFNEQHKAVDEKSLSSEKAQVYGKPFYTEWKRLYINFKDGKLTHYITDTGMEDANYIVLINGTLKLLNSKSLEFAHFSKLSNFIFPNVDNSSGQPSSSGTKSNPGASTATNSSTYVDKDRDVIDNLLFPLKYNGSFNHHNSSQKKKESWLNFKK